MRWQWYNRQAQQITLEEFSAIPVEERVVEQTDLPHGRWVSTVLLGLDHGMDNDPPLIFETMVFPSRGAWGDIACRRYASEGEARKGHAQLVEEYSRA